MNILFFLQFGNIQKKKKIYINYKMTVYNRMNVQFAHGSKRVKLLPFNFKTNKL